MQVSSQALPFFCVAKFHVGSSASGRHTLAPRSGKDSDGSASGCATSGWPSQWPWLSEVQHHTPSGGQKPATGAANVVLQGAQNAGIKCYKLDTTDVIPEERITEPISAHIVVVDVPVPSILDEIQGQIVEVVLSPASRQAPQE